VIKVDTHVHSAAAVHAQHLLRFMKEKLKSKPEEVVSISNGREITLSELMTNAGLHPRILTVSTMDMKASGIFQRFDKLRNANRPFGVEDLRTVFLRKDNYIRGRYFAELFKDQLERIEKYRFTMTEYRTSLHGRTRDDWNALAHWVLDNNVRSSCNRWLVQIPHDYDQFKKNGEIECFQDMLDNIFLPLFEVTIDPSCNPTLHEALRDISGFDSICNEGEAFEPMITSSLLEPSHWNTLENPPYAYYLYYLYGNLSILNQLRELRGLSIILTLFPTLCLMEIEATLFIVSFFSFL